MKNPKQKLKNILLLLSVFFTFSCSKDAYEESSYEASKKYKVKSLQRSEIKNLEKKLKNFKAFTKFQYENNRTEISSIYDFSIETNDVKFIEAGNIKSYTFKVNRTVDNGLFENLQIIKKADGNYVAKLLQYNLTNEEQVLFLSSGYLDVNGKLTTINIDDPSFINNINAKLRGDCYDMIITSQENPCASGEHSYGQIGCIMPPSLQAKPDSNVYTIVSVNCDTGSGGDLENGVTTTPVSGGGGGSLWNQDSFYNNITLEQQTWLDNQTSIVNESILNYLITNNFNTASKNKIYQLIDVAIATGTTFTIDPTVNATNGQVFNNANDLEDYLNTGNSSNCTTQVNNINLGERISKAVFDLGIFINLELSVKQNTNPFSVTAVTSEITGMTLGKEWHQTNSTTNNTAGFPNSAEVDVYGNMVHFIFLEGIGTVFTASEHFQIKFLKNNGSIYATIHY